MAHTVVIDRDKYVQALESDRQNLATYILAGRCADMQDYKDKTGKLSGLQTALNHFAEVVKAGDEDE